MKCNTIQESLIKPYEMALAKAEKSKATIEKYLHHVR